MKGFFIDSLHPRCRKIAFFSYEYRVFEQFVEGRIKDEWMQHYDASQKTFREKVTIKVSTFTNVLHNEDQKQ